MKKRILLLLLLLFVCTAFGFCLRSNRTKKFDKGLQALITKVLENGGSITSGSLLSDNCKSLNLNEKISQEDIESISIISIRKLSVTRKEMTQIAKLQHLESLTLYSCQLTQDAFDPLINSPLYGISLIRTTPSSAIAMPIHKMNNLRALHLFDSDIPDEFVRNCSSLNIESLGFTSSPIQTDNLKEMLPLPNLVNLILIDTNTGDDITSFINELPKLQVLWIEENPNLRCEFLRDMKNPDEIVSITIGDADINDEIFSAISRFKNLDWLDIHSNNITENSISVFRSLVNKPQQAILRSDKGFYLWPEDVYHPEVDGGGKSPVWRWWADE